MRDGVNYLQLKRAGVVALAMVLATVAQATDSARDWITRMNRALLTRNYEGVLIHQTGAMREVKRIIHRVQDGRMSERLSVVSSDGPGLEFIRNGPEWTAYYPEQHMALVQTRNRSYGFLAALNGLNDKSANYYTITDGGVVMLDGRAAERISLEPRDTLRYGYRFWLDAKTALPLKTQLVTSMGEVLEDISFISISFPEKIADERFKPEMNTAGFRWKRVDIPMYTPGLQKVFTPRADLLPAGFRTRIFTSPDEEAKAVGPRTRFIVSDGVAWVSLWVEKPAQGSAPPPAKNTQGSGAKDKPATSPSGGPGARADGVVVMGSTAGYVVNVDGFKITAVGEVPPSTVKAIAEAVRPE